MGGGPQPHLVRMDLHCAVEAVGGAVFERDLDTHRGLPWGVRMGDIHDRYAGRLTVGACRTAWTVAQMTGGPALWGSVTPVTDQIRARRPALLVAG